MRVNLCCGKEVLENGWINYDYNPFNEKVRVIDLNRLNDLVLHFRKNSVDVFRIHNGIEHLKVTDFDLIMALKPFLKSCGYMDLVVPTDSPIVNHLKHRYTAHYFNPLVHRHGKDNTKKEVFSKVVFRPYAYRSFKELLDYLLEKIRAIFVKRYFFRLYN